MNNQYFLDGEVEQPRWLESLEDFILTYQNPKLMQGALIIYGETEEDNTLIYHFGIRETGITPPIKTPNFFQIVRQTQDKIAVKGLKGDIEDNKEHLTEICKKGGFDAIYYKHTITNPLMFMHMFHECVANEYLIKIKNPNEFLEMLEGKIETAKEEAQKREVQSANGTKVSYE